MKKDKKRFTLKKFVSICLVCILLLACVPLLINAYMISFSSKYILTQEEYKEMNFDCVLVLGAGVWGDSPSHMLEERLNKSIEVYNSKCTNRLLMSGDHGQKEYDEVNVMKNFAIEKGAVSNEVFMDHAGFSTYESMYRSRDVFEVESVVIVTQKYHLYRAIYDARKLGLDAYGVEADGQYDYHISVRTYNNFRESLARCKDFIWCIIKPEPTFLGEVIPISASGDLTDDKSGDKDV